MRYITTYQVLLLTLSTIWIGMGDLWAQSKTTDHSTNILQFNCHTNNPYFLSHQDSSSIYLYIELAAGAYPEDQPPAPLNIALVMDRSGSMAGAKLDYAKEATKFMIDNLNNEDLLALITYDHEIDLVSSTIPLKNSKNRKRLKKSVDNIIDRGGTNLCGGMLEGYEQVRDHYKEDYVNRVLLMSDGYANRGITDPIRLRDTVQLINKKDQINMSTFGLGADFDEDLLELLADYGGSNYYFIHKASLVPEVFAQELKYLKTVVAKQTLVNIEFPSHVIVDQVYGFPYWQPSTNHITIPFNDLAAEEKKAALIKFIVPQAHQSDVEIQINGRFNNAFTAQDSVFANQKIVVKPIEDVEQYEASHTKMITQEQHLFLANAMLATALLEMKKGNLGEGIQMIRENQKFMQPLVKANPSDTALVNQYELNKYYIDEWKVVQSKSDYKKKMLEKVVKFKNYKLRKKKAL